MWNSSWTQWVLAYWFLGLVPLLGFGLRALAARETKVKEAKKAKADADAEPSEGDAGPQV